jgi:hypothetical protein
MAGASTGPSRCGGRAGGTSQHILSEGDHAEVEQDLRLGGQRLVRASQSRAPGRSHDRAMEVQIAACIGRLAAVGGALAGVAGIVVVCYVWSVRRSDRRGAAEAK